LIFVKLMGGLGNQMFQYAVGLRLARRRGTGLLLDRDFLLDRTPRKNFVFRDYDLQLFTGEQRFVERGELPWHFREHRARPLRLAARTLQQIDRRYFWERSTRFDARLLDAPDGSYLHGYFQSEKYFADEADAVRAAFTFEEPVPEASQALLRQIRGCNAVCLNVRRGDFVGNATHGTVGTGYLEHGAALVASRGGGGRPTIFVFSDDMDWCRENLRLPYETVFVGHEHKGERFGAYLQLMIACRHFVIPNSSFGWWAAWLASGPEKRVVAPRRWFLAEQLQSPDTVPAGWHLL
jgi:Glycosyl transferase family 11